MLMRSLGGTDFFNTYFSYFFLCLCLCLRDEWVGAVVARRQVFVRSLTWIYFVSLTRYIFFCKDTESIKENIMIINKFAEISGLKLNKKNPKAIWVGSKTKDKTKPLAIIKYN